MTKYITYTRLSKESKSKGNLGLEAQEEIINLHIKPEDILMRFSEIETGTNKKLRPVLDEAIVNCRKHKATLVVAKLDRLSRNVAFIFTLRDSGIKFMALDLPEFNTMTLGIFATFAEYEAQKISERTKSALAVKKANGVRLGRPYADSKNQELKPYIKELSQTMSYSAIANRLNQEGHVTTMGKLFSKGQVQYLAK